MSAPSTRNGKPRKVVVVGAGPGGLTAAMLLAHHGCEVEVFEKAAVVGGRNACMELGDYRFDLGPTFLMMLPILEEIFRLAGRRMDEHLRVERLDPMYRLLFGNGEAFYPTHDPQRMKAQIDRLFPGEWPGYERFLAQEARKYARITPCLQVPYSTPFGYLSKRMLRALPYLDAFTSLYAHLGRYFSAEHLKLAFTFQAKYLGMSPWQCPGTFSMISYIEHAGGVYHPIGGLNQISRAMAQAVQEDGGVLHLSCPVEEVLVEGGRAVGVRLASGERVAADAVVLNADFAHAMKHLVKPEHRRKWTDRKLDACGYSCSTFMLYLGLDRRYELPHHSILFAEDYARNVREIAETLVLSEEPSVYVQNPSVTDPTLAPEGHSTLYILVPVPNNRSGIDWTVAAPAFREKVLDLVERRGGFTGLRQHIRAERVLTPGGWAGDHAVHLGATFNLAHNIGQMLYFRPHNRFEDFRNAYLVGGGTHPGSGLPTIYESGRISAELILGKGLA